MKEETITLNDVEFRIVGENLIPISGDVSGKINNKKKHKQNLHSWKWFYSVFETNLIALRYHKTAQIKGGEKILVDKYINEEWNPRYLDGKIIHHKAISYSQRFKEERIIYNKINAELIEIQKEQEKQQNYYKSKVN